jgi:hypothetical protein
MILWETFPRVEVFRDVLSDAGSVRLRLYAYSAFMGGRQPKSICLLKGSGLASPTFA